MGDPQVRPGFVWIREGYPKCGEWYDDGGTFEPAAHDWKQSGHKVQVYVVDPSDIIDRVERLAPPEGFSVWLDEARVLRDRLDEVTQERDWLRRVVDGLLPGSGGDV